MTSRDTPAPPPATRRVFIWLLKIVVSGSLLYLLFTQLDAARLWQLMRGASPGWIATALLLYLAMLVVSTWRWQLLLRAQQVPIRFGTLLNSYFVATFANNFLPSNIGGDVIRIRDTARPAGSKTLATAIVLADRGVGVLGLGFVAATGSTLAARRSDLLGPMETTLLWGGLAAALFAAWLVLAVPDRLIALLRPLRRLHAEWVERRLELVTSALHRFGRAPGAMLVGFAGAIVVQTILVGFYAAVAAAIHLAVPLGHLAILVPLSFLVQMVPVSVNGLGVREATFGVYLSGIGVPLESAVALSFIGAALVALFSMSGAAAYLARRRQHAATPDLPD